jgi:hypothetical protein
MYKQCYFKELRFVDSGEVEKVLGRTAIRLEGLSIVVYDTKQFMPVRCFERDLTIIQLTIPFLPKQHFYHWWGEIVLGSWRVYTAIFATMSPPPPFPARFILPVCHIVYPQIQISH